MGGRYDGLSEGYNGWARKYDDSSALEYTHLFNGANDGGDSIEAVAVSDDGYAVLVGGENRADLGEGANVWTRRLGQDGTEFWTRTYAGAQFDYGYAVAIDASGNVIVAGTTYGGDSDDVWVRKYDQDGGAIWTREYDGGEYSSAVGVAVDDMGRVAVAATVATGSDGTIWVRQYDEDGAELWTNTYDSGNDAGYLGDTATGIAVDSDRNVIVTGAAVTDDSASFNAWVRKYDDTGAESWTQQWHIGVPVATAYSYAYGVAIDSMDNIIVVGGESLDAGAADAWVRKLAP